MTDRSGEIGEKLLHGAPEDFDPAVLETVAIGVEVFRLTLYGAPFVDNWDCVHCGERNPEDSRYCDSCGEPREHAK